MENQALQTASSAILSVQEAVAGLTDAIQYGDNSAPIANIEKAFYNLKIVAEVLLPQYRLQSILSAVGCRGDEKAKAAADQKLADTINDMQTAIEQLQRRVFAKVTVEDLAGYFATVADMLIQASAKKENV